MAGVEDKEGKRYGVLQGMKESGVVVETEVITKPD